MGELARKGESRPVTRDDLALVERARTLQALQQVPVLQRAGNPHEYLFFALFDGTGQDAGDPTQRPTNVGLLSKQAALLALDPAHRVGYKYVEGIGTQPNPLARYADAWIPYTWDDRIEEAYRALANQVKEWKEQDPQAQVRLVAVGYSRGAVLAAGLTRLVDRYGIADPEGLTFGRDAHGRITVVAERPPLLTPGQVAQAMGLFDPVATHLPPHYDARRAPSVISAMALAAVHERREAFPHQAILEPGLSADRRFVNLPMPGGHADVGGGNRDPGLETLAFNAMADYLNGLRDRPLFAYRPLPDDPRLYTIHQVRGLTAVPGLDGDGLRDLRRELADCRTVDPCRDGEPVDQALAARFAYRRQPPTAPLPSLADLRQEAAGMSKAALPVDLRDPAHPGHLTYTRTLAAVQRMEASRGIAHGPHSEQAAAALTVEAARHGLAITHVELDAQGKLLGLERWYATAPPRMVSVESRHALSLPMAEHALRWPQTPPLHHAHSQPVPQDTVQAVDAYHRQPEQPPAQDAMQREQPRLRAR